jgi:hypothetical protein
VPRSLILGFLFPMLALQREAAMPPTPIAEEEVIEVLLKCLITVETKDTSAPACLA